LYVGGLEIRSGMRYHNSILVVLLGMDRIVMTLKIIKIKIGKILQASFPCNL